MDQEATRFAYDRAVRIAARALVAHRVERPDDAPAYGDGETVDKDADAAETFARTLLLDADLPGGLETIADLLLDGQYEEAMQKAATGLKRHGGPLSSAELSAIKASRNTMGDDAGAQARALAAQLMGTGDEEVDAATDEHNAAIEAAREAERAAMAHSEA